MRRLTRRLARRPASAVRCRRATPHHRLVLVLAGALVAVAACAGPSGSGVSGTASTSVTDSGSRPVTATSTPTTGSTGPSLPARTVTHRDVPGAAYERGPAPGQALAVLGVAAGSTLPLRDLPGTGGTVLESLTPLTTRLVATGRARVLASGTRSSVWVEVSGGGLVGWVDGGHLAAPAATTDLTAEVVGRLGRRPVAGTMLDLGRTVAQVYVSEEPPSRVTVTVAPTVGDLGEITLDVVGLGDDSVAGMRLHVFGTPGTQSFTLKSVEATPFCSRGVTASGLCA